MSNPYPLKRTGMAVQLSLLEESRLRDPQADDRTHVIRLADQVIADLDPSPPVRVEMVASYLGISQVRLSPLDSAGCLVTDTSSGRVTIHVRVRDSQPRRRFTALHEATHTFFPGYARKTQWRCNPQAELEGPMVEQLCDVGAAEMLIPRRLAGPQLERAGFGMTTVEELRREYDASLQAAANRVVELYPEDTLLLTLEVMTKPSQASVPGAEPCLRVRSFSCSGEWPFVRRFKSVPAGSPLMRALEGEAVDERGALKDLTAQPVERVEVSARVYPFVDQEGVRHERVLALYRRLPYKPSRRVAL